MKNRIHIDLRFDPPKSEVLESMRKGTKSEREVAAAEHKAAYQTLVTGAALALGASVVTNLLATTFAINATGELIGGGLTVFAAVAVLLVTLLAGPIGGAVAFLGIAGLTAFQGPELFLYEPTTLAAAFAVTVLPGAAAIGMLVYQRIALQAKRVQEADAVLKEIEELDPRRNMSECLWLEEQAGCDPEIQAYYRAVLAQRRGPIQAEYEAIRRKVHDLRARRAAEAAWVERGQEVGSGSGKSCCSAG